MKNKTAFLPIRVSVFNCGFPNEQIHFGKAIYLLPVPIGSLAPGLASQCTRRSVLRTGWWHAPMLLSNGSLGCCPPQACHRDTPGRVLLLCWVIWMCHCFDPLFWDSGDRTRSFRGTFSHPPTPKRSFEVLKLQILAEFDLFGPKFHFSLDLLGSNFQKRAAHPHHFSDRVPPRGDSKGPCPLPGLMKNRQVDMTKIKSLLQKRQTSLCPGHEWLAIAVLWFHWNVFILATATSNFEQRNSARNGSDRVSDWSYQESTSCHMRKKSFLFLKLLLWKISH